MFGKPRKTSNFQARSANRDEELDRGRIMSIAQSIDAALRSAESEYSGLSSRLEDTLSRAAITLGNESDEYIFRDPVIDLHQSLFNSQVTNAERRLAELTNTINHLKSLRTDLTIRFSVLLASR